MSEARNAPPPRTEGDKPIVLVVDDVAVNREILRRRLMRRNYDVVEAASGTEALDRIAAEVVDIVLLDIMMPDLDGREVMRIVRRDRSPAELPILMVSAKTLSEDVNECMRLGANGFITKPVDFAAMLAQIEDHLGAAGGARKAG